MFRNVYEFYYHFEQDNKSAYPVALHPGMRRILATHFDDAYKLFLKNIKPYFDAVTNPSKNPRIEIVSAIRVTEKVEV